MSIFIMYVTIMPIIIGGIGNMVFTKTNLYKENATPIDGHRVLKDGRPIFGKNKTWVGFWGMIIITGAMQVFWGIVLKVTGLEEYNQLYIFWENTIIFNLLVGLLFGALYVIFELPNSFIKRRLNISSGKTDRGMKGIVFFVADQFDSIIGIGVAIGILARLSLQGVVTYILLGGFTHIAVNLILYGVKVRKNI